jgi:hypothetical protein
MKSRSLKAKVNASHLQSKRTLDELSLQMGEFCRDEMMGRPCFTFAKSR